MRAAEAATAKVAEAEAATAATAKVAEVKAAADGELAAEEEAAMA